MLIEPNLISATGIISHNFVYVQKLDLEMESLLPVIEKYFVLDICFIERCGNCGVLLKKFQMHICMCVCEQVA
jgi:hypothetical protein